MAHVSSSSTWKAEEEKRSGLRSNFQTSLALPGNYVRKQELFTDDTQALSLSLVPDKLTQLPILSPDTVLTIVSCFDILLVCERMYTGHTQMLHHFIQGCHLRTVMPISFLTTHFRDTQGLL